MPRACVIVLDAVGAGELPDAADWGDEGSDTLGNVARPSAGSTCPTSRRSGSGTSSRSRAARRSRTHRPSQGGCSSARRARTRPPGHWELMGVVTPTPFPTYPYGFPDDVIDPFMNRTGRGVLGNKPASGTEIIQELGEEHQRDGEVDRLHVRRLRLPDRRARGDDPARGALRRLSGRAGDPHGQARRRPRDRAAVHRRARALRADAEPPRLLARAAAAELPERDPRRRATRCTASARSRDIFAGCDIDESFPTKSNVDGINRTIELLENIDSGLVFVNLVETDQLWGHRNDPVNFHRCLQDFDRRLPDILDTLRDGDLLIITSDHGCDPTTPSTDHSREHALLLAYAAGKNAAGKIHEEGEFGDVGATVCAWLGAKHPGKGARVGRSSSDERRPRLERSGVRRAQYETEVGLAARKAAYRETSRARMPRQVAFEAMPWRSPIAMLEVGVRRGRARRAPGRASRRRRARGRPVAADGRADTGARRRRARRRRRRICRSRTGRFDAVARRVDALPRAGPRSRARRDRARARARRAARRRDELRPTISSELLAPRRDRALGRAVRRARTATEILGRHFATCERRDVDGTVTFRRHRRRPVVLRVVGASRSAARPPAGRA